MNPKEIDISNITSQEQKLLTSKETLERLHGMGKIDANEYQEKMRAIETQRHKLQDYLDDSIADMLFGEELAPVHKTYVGQNMSDEDLAEAIQIGEVVRGHIEDKRVIEVTFSYDSVKCKARITNNKGVWTFSSKAKKLAKGLFIRALEQNEEVVSTFCHEINRHPDDWEELVTKTHPGNFPRQVQEEFDKRLTASKESDFLPSTEHETTHTVVIHIVKHGPLPKDLVRKKVGKNHCFITIRINVDGELLNLSVDTDREKWKSSSTRLSKDALSTIIPDMIAVIEKPENHIYLNRMISEIRKNRKQWIDTVMNNPQLFPKAVRQIFR